MQITSEQVKEVDAVDEQICDYLDFQLCEFVTDYYMIQVLLINP